MQKFKTFSSANHIKQIRKGKFPLEMYNPQIPKAIY